MASKYDYIAFPFDPILGLMMEHAHECIEWAKTFRDIASAGKAVTCYTTPHDHVGTIHVTDQLLATWEDHCCLQDDEEYWKPGIKT